MLNVVALMGRLVYEPELKTTPSGINVCSFRVAVDRSFTRQGEERKADFIDVTAWRPTAEFVSTYFQQGSMIAIMPEITHVKTPVLTSIPLGVERAVEMIHQMEKED